MKSEGILSEILKNEEVRFPRLQKLRFSEDFALKSEFNWEKVPSRGFQVSLSFRKKVF